jgi:peptide deformylase
MSAIIQPVEIVVPDEFRYLYVQNDERPVVKVPAPCLRTVCQPVQKVTKKTQELIDRLISVMRKANGIGLAAPQLGVTQRVIVIAPEGMRPLAFVNPVILSMEGEQIGQEGCLSIPGLYGDVKRAAAIELRALDRKGRAVQYRMEGLPARVVQHEVDHLDGVLFTDKVDPATLRWMHPDGEPDTP